MKLPGICIDCRAPLVWTGSWWRRAGSGNWRRHRCPCDQLTRYGDPCARPRHDAGGHRSLYAINNDRMARGLKAYTIGDEVSVASHESARFPLTSVEPGRLNSAR